MSALPAAAGGKVCVVCGTDVSRKPRVKDTEGRYMCEGLCEQAARERAKAAAVMPAAKPAPPKPSAKPIASAPESNDFDMMDQLLSSSPAANAQGCPGCGQPLMAGAVLCMRCGFDTRSGRAQRTRMAVDKAPKAAGPIRMPRKRGEFGPSFSILLLISVGVFCGPAVLGAFSMPVFAIAYLLCMIGSLVAYVWAIVAAFQSGNQRYGIYGLLVVVPIVGLISLVFLFWSMVSNPDKWSRALMIGTFFAALLLTVILFTTYGGVEGLTKLMEP